MSEYKTNTLNKICYTELVYKRINKKLKINFSNLEIEEMIFRVIEETKETLFEKIGKNIYITNLENNIKITINTHTYRVITVNRIV